MLLAAGCATPPEDPVARAAFDEAADPLEPFNRFMFDASFAFDDAVFKPVAKAYRDVVPEPMRDALRNLLRNLRSPLILANDLLQGEPRRAGVTLQRFLVNSAIGFAGLVDVADLAIGLKFHDEDFGQTLAVWGAGEGFYLFLPVLGPSSARDLGGLIVDGVVDPVSHAFAYYDVEYGPFARAVLTALDARSRAIDSLEDTQKTSIDFYAALRSLYRQKREDEILNGREPPGGRRAPTLESPAVSAAASDSSAPPGPTPATAASAAPMPAPSASPPPAAPLAWTREGAGAAPPFPGRYVDWSAWEPDLAFNPPVFAPAPPEASVQLAAYRPAAAPALPPAPLPVPGGAAGAAEPVAVILFRKGSADLDANSRALLRRLAAGARERGQSLRVVGHADERVEGLDDLGARFFNFDMSWARAAAAAEELERAGLPLQRIVIEAMGETEPLRPAPGDATGGDAPGNRRVSVYLQ
ncbi:MAG: MlaA family lipoprotein [Rhodospirillales bacterium]